MKAEFDFPRFKDLQLGKYGERDGCGCLFAKMDEIEMSSAMEGIQQDKFELYIRDILGLEMPRLTSYSCPNTLSNRRKAYRALEQAVGKMGYEIGL